MRMKTLLAENEDKMRNYERLLHKVTQLNSTVINDLSILLITNQYMHHVQSESEVTRQSEDNRLNWDIEEGKHRL